VAGAPLRDMHFEQGVESPCGARVAAGDAGFASGKGLRRSTSRNEHGSQPKNWQTAGDSPANASSKAIWLSSSGSGMPPS
jgi:hypothetical protein